MMHSSPMPLTVALDIAKRLQHELAKHMTPEHKRDFSRLEHLIAEAQRAHRAAQSHSKTHASLPHQPHAPDEKHRRSFWPR